MHELPDQVLVAQCIEGVRLTTTKLTWFGALVTALFLFMASLARADEPLSQFTVSKPYTCSQSNCQAVPLDQGGILLFRPLGGGYPSEIVLYYAPLGGPTWEICGLSSSTFCGLGVVPNKGGAYLQTYNVPAPPRWCPGSFNGPGCVGASGTETFTWIMAQPSDGDVFQGTLTVTGHWVSHVSQKGSYSQDFVVESADLIIIDQSTVAILDFLLPFPLLGFIRRRYTWAQLLRAA